MIDGKTVVAIIPARGGSEGIPRKNVLPIAGKPLLAYVVGEALASRTVDRVLVSTDYPEIAAVARRFGAEVIDRPAEISGSRVSSESALLHALETLKEQENYEPDILVFLQCTSVLTSAEDIDRTVETLIRQEADTALAVTDFHYFLWKVADGNAVGINHDKRFRPMRQDREPQFLETGGVYVMRVDGFKSAGYRFFGKTALYETPKERSFEIDDPPDLIVAEALLRFNRQRGQLTLLPKTIGALVFDFDGVFTDNRVIVDQDGVESVSCDRSDGWGLGRLKRLGVPMLVLSTEKNPVVRARCGKLGLPCIHGVDRKWPALQAWLSEHAIDPETAIYVGNDVNDLECLQNVGCGVTPADAYPQAKSGARIVLESPGGRGAVREIVELVLARLGKKDEILGG